MTRSGIIRGVVAALVVGCAVAGFAVVWRPTIAPINPPSAQSFDPRIVKDGRELAAIGNCRDCHTVRGGKDFAGGLPVPTPFGTVFSTNITPDADTGIGRWSEAAFHRAMRSGVDRQGRHLYPAFPYDHFINVTDADDRALYAYLMTRQPVRAPARKNELPFPLNLRWLIAGWKLLYLDASIYKPDPTKSAEWNRGAYLVEGLAHCGACHTPRNALGAERPDAAFAGGEADGWTAYAINAQSPAPVPWNAKALYAYLRHGWHPDHGAALGPMAQVVSHLSSVPPSEVHAIAAYMATVVGPEAPKRERATTVGQANSALTLQQSQTGSQGEAIYKAACATCHESGRPPPYGGINLVLSTAISSPDPRNAASIILMGVRPVEGERSPIMPGFVNVMNDGEVPALLDYLRSRFSRRPAWRDLEKTLVEARRAQAAYVRTSVGPDSAPADPAQRGKP